MVVLILEEISWLPLGKGTFAALTGDSIIIFITVFINSSCIPVAGQIHLKHNFEAKFIYKPWKTFDRLKITFL